MTEHEGELSPVGSTDWHAFRKWGYADHWDYEDEFDAIDDELPKSGTLSNRPTSAPTGSYYRATDARIIFRYDESDSRADGDGWVAVSGYGSSSDRVPGTAYHTSLDVGDTFSHLYPEESVTQVTDLDRDTQLNIDEPVGGKGVRVVGWLSPQNTQASVHMRVCNESTSNYSYKSIGGNGISTSTGQTSWRLFTSSGDFARATSVFVDYIVMMDIHPRSPTGANAPSISSRAFGNTDVNNLSGGVLTVNVSEQTPSIQIFSNDDYAADLRISNVDWGDPSA